VYKARLRPEIISGSFSAPPTAQRHGSEDELQLSSSVAIKVLHPRVTKTVRRDIAIMSVFANIINAFPGMQWISLPEEVAVFGQMMNSQLDLRVEAANLNHFDRNFRKRGPRVTFPRPIKLGKNGNGDEREESREVLIEEFEDALPLKWFLRNGGGPYDHKIANIGLDAFLVRRIIGERPSTSLMTQGNALARQLDPWRSSSVSDQRPPC
jgi:aarF domain-containing kinase